MSALAGWKTLPLIDVATLQRGYDLPVQDRIPGSVPILAATSEVGTHTYAKVAGPGVVTGRSGSIGNVQFVEQDYWPLNTTLYVKDFHGNDPRFIYYLLQQLDLQRYHEGTGVPTLNRNNIHTIQVVIPPVPEQRRIAAVLDRAEAIRAQRRVAFAQLDGLMRAIFLEMFGDPVANEKGWPRSPFHELLTSIESGWSPTCLDRPVIGNEWGVLKLGAVTWCEYHAEENKALPTGVMPEASLEVQPGDLLFTRKNTYELVAACALVRATPPRLCLPDLIFRLRLAPSVGVAPVYLHQLLIHPTKRREIQKLASGSAGSMPNISKARLMTAMIELPPLTLQQEFARRVETAERLKSAHRASLAEMDALFASLQHRAFRGEL
jgi:type I restriction enzyme S subunit